MYFFSFIKISIFLLNKIAEKNREIDVVLQKKKTIILPGSFVKRLNDVCLSILCLYVLFSTPIYIAFFTTENYLDTVAIIFECIFCFLFILVKKKV